MNTLKVATFLLVAGLSIAHAETAALDPSAHRALAPVQEQSPCQTHQTRTGFTLPDPACSPGAINPTVSLEVLRDSLFTTRLLRDAVTSHREKEVLYARYGLEHPEHNRGKEQICELDHIVPLELGGADSLDNIFPMCDTRPVPFAERSFHLKDIVEHYLSWAVRSGQIPLETAQQDIAQDWTRHLNAALAACPQGRCPSWRGPALSALTEF